jgi:ABC-type multidrug transport system ATPase subunit
MFLDNDQAYEQTFKGVMDEKRNNPIVNNPHILLADEPTGNLDSKTSGEVMSLFRELNDSGQTVVMVTHNPENGAYSDRTIYLKDGKIAQHACLHKYKIHMPASQTHFVIHCNYLSYLF